MNIFKRLKKGVLAVKMASENDIMSEERILKIINRAEKDEKHKFMLVGKRYYTMDNDVKHRNSKAVNAEYKADNRLVHASYKNIVDEKIGYLFSNEPTIRADEEGEKYLEQIKEVLGSALGYKLESLGIEASNKGIAWLHPYIKDSKLHFFVVPSEQVIPIWLDASHTELEAVIRVYETEVWRFNDFKKVKIVEYHTAEGSVKYRNENNTLLKITDEEEGHFKIDGENAGWGRVPFIPFKNNRDELSDLTFVKSLVDNYDFTRSEVANYIEEVKNMILILKGYEGQAKRQLLTDIYKERAVSLDIDGDLSALTPQIDITATREHFEQLKRDIIDSGQGVNRDLDKFGSAPSGVALQFLFSNLDLKANKLASEFRRGFKRMLYFVDEFLILNALDLEKSNIELIFDKNLKMDVSEAIINCSNSKGIISDSTILANHPWVDDVESEKERLKAQDDALENEFLSYEDEI